jgi:UDP-2,3-diacylglucosamine pyrophosphatase LpxH
MGANTALVKAQKDWAEVRCRSGVDLVVLGHSHAPGITELSNGKLVNLGDFVTEHTYLEIDSGLHLLRWQSGHGHTVEQQSIL